MMELIYKGVFYIEMITYEIMLIFTILLQTRTNTNSNCNSESFQSPQVAGVRSDIFRLELMSAAVELLYTGLWHWGVASASASAHRNSDPRFWQSHYLHQLKLNFVTQHWLCFCHIGSLVLSSQPCASCFSASPWPFQHHRYAFYRCYKNTLYSKMLQIKLPCHLHTIIIYAHFSSDLSVSNAFIQLVTNQAGSLLDPILIVGIFFLNRPHSLSLWLFISSFTVSHVKVLLFAGLSHPKMNKHRTCTVALLSSVTRRITNTHRLRRENLFSHFHCHILVRWGKRSFKMHTVNSFRCTL